MYDHERSLVQEMQGKPFALVGVNSDGDRAAIRKIAEEKNLIWRSFFVGRDPAVPVEFGVEGWPTIFIIDAKGMIRHRDIRGDAINSAVKDLLKEMESGA